MSTSNKSPKILSVNDTKILDCQFCSNNVSVKIDRANDLISGITDVDIILIEDKQLAKDLTKLKKFMKQSTDLANQINARYWNSIDKQY